MPSNVIIGRAQINQRPIVLVGDDFTVRGGANDGAVGDKMIFAEQMACDLRLPLVRLIDGTGGGGSVKNIEKMGHALLPKMKIWASITRSLAQVPCVSLALGSVAGQAAFPRCVSYVTSKAAIEGLTRALALDWARDKIRVLCMAPGYVESDISKDILSNEASRDWILKRIPLRRVAKPEEVAVFVAFLVSPRVSFATGEVYYLDGGQRMAI
jgi:hypothetical protein